MFLATALATALIWAAAGERKPLPRPRLRPLQHAPTGIRYRLDPATRQPVEYSLNGKIEFDEKSGAYDVSWVGSNQKTIRLTYEPRNKLDAIVAASVAYDPAKRLYRYTYTLINLPSSQQKFHSLYLETKAPVVEWGSPDRTWYVAPFTDFLQQKFRATGGIGWSQTMGGKLGLPAGEQASGFSLLSQGLPAMVRCYAEGYTPALRSPEEMPEELHAAIDSIAWDLPYGVTVGPVTPPEPFEPAAFTRSIAEMVQASLGKGWIKSPAVAHDFRESLSQVRRALKTGQEQDASRIVESLLDRLNREKDHTVLPEASSLLRWNLEYLNGKLAVRK